MDCPCRLALILLAALAIPAAAQEEVESLLKKLGSDSREEREAASQELTRRGRSVREAVERTAKNPDPEIAGRARRILEAMDSGFEAVADVLDRLAAEEMDSHQRFLWKAQKWLEKAVAGRSWQDLLASLERQKIVVTDVWERESEITYRYLARKAAVSTPQGRALDLFFEFKLKRAAVPDQRTLWSLEAASIGLDARFSMTLREAVAAPQFPADSALQKVLANPELPPKDAATPYLDGIEMTYGPIRDRWSESIPQGFHIRVHCVDHPEGRIRTFRGYFSVSSGLDPAETHAGVSLNSGVFIPKDTTGGVRSWGSNGSGPSGHGLRRLDLPSPREPFFYMGYSKEILSEAWSLPDLAALPAGIRKLRVRGAFLSDDGVKELARFTSLETLHLCESGFGDGAVPALAALPALSSLCIRAEKMTDRGFEQLKGLAKLRRLEISRAALMTDEGAGHIGALKSLTFLELHGGKKISDQALQALSGLDNLEEFDFGGQSSITDAGLVAIARLPKLRSLRLSELKEVTPAGWKALARAPALRELHFTYCSLDDAGLAALAGIKDVEFLAFYQWREEGKITDEGLLSLKGLKNLRRLNIYSKPVTLEGMKALGDQLPGRYFPY
ncbi:MAG: hypothetical protein HY293_01455 [Planctomycetes bacterium]|nr:hypothetical protein [Planctomycetota bacterium]